MGENGIKMNCFCVQYTEMVAHLDTMGKKVEKHEGHEQQKQMCSLTSARHSHFLRPLASALLGRARRAGSGRSQQRGSLKGPFHVCFDNDYGGLSSRAISSCPLCWCAGCSIACLGE